MKPLPTLRLLPCDPDKDGPALLEQQIAAFSNPIEPFFFVLNPATEDFEKAVRRSVENWLGDTTARYVKVVDEDGKLISAAKWLVKTSPLSEEQKKEHVHVAWHPDADSNEWAEHLINWIHQHQILHTRGEPCVILDMLTTHPSYQRLGAGTLLMKYGTSIADELKLPAFIEGTIAAKHLYETHGFRALNNEFIDVPVPEKWRDRPVVRFFFYEREVRGDGIEQEGERVGEDVDMKISMQWS